MPFLFPLKISGSNESKFIFFSTASIVLSVGFYTANEKLINWLISDIVYALLIIMTCKNGLYGIGLAGMSLDGLHPAYSFEYAIVSSFFAAAIIFVLQLAIKGVLIAYRAIRKKR